MSRSSYLPVHVDRVIKETENAFLFAIENSDDGEVWVPKSQCNNAQSINEDDEDLVVEVTAWFVKKTNLPTVED